MTEQDLPHNIIIREYGIELDYSCVKCVSLLLYLQLKVKMLYIEQKLAPILHFDIEDICGRP